MKLHLSLLDKLIDLPSKDPKELRQVLDDLGLEVKGVEGQGLSTIFTLETLANRGDHLSAHGIAREFSARYLTSLRPPAIAAPFTDRKASIPIRKNTDLCLRYGLLEMTVSASMNLRSDISAVMGASDKHPMVDLLNYILLEIGQPMHAFDRDKIDGEILIEQLTTPEKIIALDGKEYEVPAQALVIKDKKKIVAVAGVIGCANSMMTKETTRVLIESACFDPVTVRKAARAMGLSTDASYTFERGSDIEAVVYGLRRLAQLAQGSSGAVKEQDSAHVIGYTLVEGKPIDKRKIEFPLVEFKKNMNLPRLADIEITTRLKNLGYTVETATSNSTILCSVPSWRMWDVKNPEDLIEDFARAHGLSKVKLDLPELDYEMPEPTPIEQLMQRIEPVLLGNGFYEVMTKSYYSAQDVELLSQLHKKISANAVTIKNSIDRGYSHCKSTNIIHLTQLLESNLRRGILGAKVFELARVFSRNDERNTEYAFERDVLTLACAGRWSHADWKKSESLSECIRLFKGVIEGIVSAAGFIVSFSESDHPFLHPGYQATIKTGRFICGSMGLVHPAIKAGLDGKNDVLYAEFEIGQLIKSTGEQEFQLPSDFPAIKRDLTLKVSARETASRVERKIEELKLPDFESVTAVDDFQKQGEDFRRLTVRLTFQSTERTLESANVDKAMELALGELKEKHGLELA